MVKKMLGFIVFAVFMMVATTAMAASFVELGADASDSVYYLAKGSVSSRGDYKVGWIKLVPSKKYSAELAKDLNNKKPGYVMMLWAANKKAKQTQVLSTTIYDPKGNVMDSAEEKFNPKNYEEVTPDTVAEFIYNGIISSK
ncbi:MAG: hypothetical protein RR272_04785 [Synergistaceae bacterium]